MVFQILSWRIIYNPVNDRFSVLLPQWVERAELKVYNMLGQFIESMPVTESQSQISVLHWTKGAYIIKLILPNGQVQSFKLIKV
jgi:hypothetical protein